MYLFFNLKKIALCTYVDKKIDALFPSSNIPQSTNPSFLNPVLNISFPYSGFNQMPGIRWALCKIKRALLFSILSRLLKLLCPSKNSAVLCLSYPQIPPKSPPCTHFVLCTSPFLPYLSTQRPKEPAWRRSGHGGAGGGKAQECSVSSIFDFPRDR